jgi:hypothetical protein
MVAVRLRAHHPLSREFMRSRIVPKATGAMFYAIYYRVSYRLVVRADS